MESFRWFAATGFLPEHGAEAVPIAPDAPVRGVFEVTRAAHTSGSVP